MATTFLECPSNIAGYYALFHYLSWWLILHLRFSYPCGGEGDKKYKSLVGIS